MRAKSYTCCVYSCMLHGSETWPVKKEKLTLQWAEMRMIRWMRGNTITDKFSSSEIKERLGIDDIITKIQ